MEDWQQRLVEERDDLLTRLVALRAVLASARPVHAHQRQLMKRQAYYMNAYLGVLDERLKEVWP